MSGIKPQELTRFYALLRERGLTTDLLAEQLDVSGGVVRRLIGGFRPRRGPTWRAFLRLLTDDERKLIFDVEQCPTWNVRQSEKRPVMTPEKDAVLRAAKQPRQLVDA
jgi:hypothetical protein